MSANLLQATRRQLCAQARRYSSKINDVVVVSAARTPIGSFQSQLAPMSATQLGATAIEAAIERAGIGKGDVNEVIMGNVVSAGLGQAPARQAAMRAGGRAVGGNVMFVCRLLLLLFCSYILVLLPLKIWQHWCGRLPPSKIVRSGNMYHFGNNFKVESLF